MKVLLTTPPLEAGNTIKVSLVENTVVVNDHPTVRVAEKALVGTSLNLVLGQGDFN